MNPDEQEPLPADGILEPAADDVPAEGPACRACGSPLSGDQDWCLECGTAVTPPRRIPGLRAVGLAGALTLVLAGGAVAAAYAALNDEQPAPQTKIRTVATAPPPTTTTTAPPVTTTTPVEPVPPPPVTTTPVTPTTTTTTPTTTTTTPTTPTTPKPVDTSIELAAGAGSLYDPLVRATASGDPQRAIDGNPATSWFVTTPADGDMKVGYLIDLGERMTVKKLALTTRTPGFSFQVLAAEGADPPQAFDDPAWTDIGGAGSVDVTPPAGQPPVIAPATGDKPGDEALALKLDAKGKKYRQIMLWFTVPPTAGPTVRLTEVKLFG